MHRIGHFNDIPQFTQNASKLHPFLLKKVCSILTKKKVSETKTTSLISLSPSPTFHYHYPKSPHYHYLPNSIIIITPTYHNDGQLLGELYQASPVPTL